MEISDYCREYKVAYLEVVSTVSFKRETFGSIDNLPYKGLYQYCSNSFKQFLLIAKKYLEIICGSQKHTIAESEQIEKQFRHYIQQIDPTALSDENNMWSIYAEEIGYSI